MIEIKGGDKSYPGIEKRTVESIQKFKAHSWTIVQSGRRSTVEHVERLDNKIETYCLMGTNFTNYYQEIRDQFRMNNSVDFTFDGVAVGYKILSAASVDSVKQLGLGVFTFTVNDTNAMKMMIG